MTKKIIDISTKTAYKSISECAQKTGYSFWKISNAIEKKFGQLDSHTFVIADNASGDSIHAAIRSQYARLTRAKNLLTEVIADMNKKRPCAVLTSKGRYYPSIRECSKDLKLAYNTISTALTNHLEVSGLRFYSAKEVFDLYEKSVKENKLGDRTIMTKILNRLERTEAFVR